MTEPTSEAAAEALADHGLNLDSYVKGLLHELENAVRWKNDEAVKAVKAELTRFGHRENTSAPGAVETTEAP